MDFQPWSTADLMEVVYAPSDLPDNFWLKFFTRTYNSTEKTIYFDKIPNLDRRLAPFVAPNVQGRIMSSRGTQVASFTPAYVKPKHVVDPSRGFTRRPGEPVFGLGPTSLTPAQRIDAQIAQNVTDERDMIERRWDWMACQAICFASITVEGDDYPSRTVNFGRDSSLTTILTGSARWGQVDADPLADIQESRNAAFPLGRAPITDLIFGSTAWPLFASDTKVQALLSTQKRGSETNFNNALTNGEPYQFMGQISGPDGGGLINLWVYSNWYEAEDGSIQQFLDPRDVIGVGSAIQGVQCFGAIEDLDSMQPVSIFPSTWTQKDPSRRFTMCQSAPLMVPVNPNNTFRIRATDTI